MHDEAAATPRIEALMGPTDIGLYEAVLLQKKGRQAYEDLLKTLYPPDNPDDDVERLGCETTLDESLEALNQEGFITTYPVGDEENFYQWEYELTPAGAAEAQKVNVTQEGEMLHWQAMGTDGKMHARLDPMLADE